MEKNDLNEFEIITALFERVKKMEAKEISKTSDRWYLHQPFVLSMALGFREDLDQQAFAQMVEIYMVMWEYYKDKPNIKTIKLEQVRYANIERGNVGAIHLFKKWATKGADHSHMLRDVLGMRSKILFIVISQKLMESPSMTKVDMGTRGIILVGVKSVIDGLDEIVGKGKNP